MKSSLWKMLFHWLLLLQGTYSEGAGIWNLDCHVRLFHTFMCPSRYNLAINSLFRTLNNLLMRLRKVLCLSLLGQWAAEWATCWCFSKELKVMFWGLLQKCCICKMLSVVFWTIETSLSGTGKFIWLRYSSQVGGEQALCWLFPVWYVCLHGHLRGFPWLTSSHPPALSSPPCCSLPLGKRCRGPQCRFWTTTLATTHS